MGKPSDVFEEASQSVETPQKLKPTLEERNDNATENSFQLQELPVNSTPITNDSITKNDHSSKNNVALNPSTPKPLSVTTTSLFDHECDCPLSRRIGPMPHKIPGKVWVPARILHDEEKSFEERILNKMVGSSGSKKQVKQRKIDLKTKVITNDQLLAQLKWKEQEDKEKEEWKLERKRKAGQRKEKKVEKQKTKKRIKMDYSSESDENDVVLEEETMEQLLFKK